MLKLKKVELQGFKSFCDRTELRFRGDGIAAVVGPNGCGKSNLSDAISWVLGEQSAKSLRGSRMEDVIFAGTRERKPLGMASVTMTLLDPSPSEHPVELKVVALPENGANGHGPVRISSGEITITRRLFRSGESEYLINGRIARLRDIQDLFMGSGLGPESYAIIEQGRIGQILSSRPYDRRAVIEEAAGITKFKQRKRLSEAKLESAKQNLARVFDILEEVTRQATSLKRQAQRTKRYGELKAELETRLTALLGLRSVQLEAEVTAAAAALETATSELHNLAAQVSAADTEREELQTRCYALEGELTQARSALANLNLEAERTRGKLEAQVRESAAIEVRLTRGEGEMNELETRVEQTRAERSIAAEETGHLESSIAEARKLMLEKNAAREALQTQVREQEKALEHGRILVLRLLGEASSLKNQLAQIEEFLAGMDRETVRVRREQESAAVESERLEAQRTTLAGELQQREAALEALLGERRGAEAELTDRRRASSELRHAIDALRADAGRLRARKESLENVLNHHSYTTESVKRLLAAIQRDGNRIQPVGVLADFVEADASIERAAEEFLHHELEYVVVRDWSEAESGMQLLRSDLEGRATFVVENAPPPSAAALPEIPLARLASHLRLTNGLSAQAEWLLPRLAGCFLASSSEEAREYAAQFPQLWFLLSDGSCYQGQTLTGGRKKSSGPLALKREVREIGAALTAKDRELSGQLAAQEDLSRAVAELEANLEQLRHTQQSREKDLVALHHESRRLNEESTRASSRMTIAGREIERLEREKERSAAQGESNREAVERKEVERAERERFLEAARVELDSTEAEAARTREDHASLRAELATLEERFRAQTATLERLHRLDRETNDRRQNLGSEMARWGEHRSRLLAENIDLETRSAQLSEETIGAEAHVARLASGESEHRAALAAKQNLLKDLRGGVEHAHGKRGEIEVGLVRLQSDWKHLDEWSQKELGRPLVEVERPEHVPETDAVAESERSYTEVRNKIDSLGPINPTALEEFEAASQRQEFLTSQRQDLIASIRDTEKAIAEIDAHSKTRFVDAFEAINRNFRECFTTLFGGGTGEMRLTDAENAGESGIDIVASPPGKKLQNVLLLSGGEKALAALALLMAIFRYQPSPFCVLDEVDAPLDEANIGRLTRLLREMSMETQFIVITHSRKTMESAQSMYGVTMQEAGVSKLVSVKITGEREQARLAEPAVA